MVANSDDLRIAFQHFFANKLSENSKGVVRSI